MAVLLAMYQKMRLTREKNQTTYDLTKFSGKLSRVQKNIERQQKLFTSKLAKIDEQAKRMQSQAKSIFQQMAGLGTGNYSNISNPYGFTGMNGFVAGVMQNVLLNQGVPYKDGENTAYHKLDQTKYSELLNVYMSNGGRFDSLYETTKDKDGRLEIVKDENNNPKYKSGFTHLDIQAFTQAMQSAQMQQQQAQGWAGQMAAMYDQNVSIWVEAAKAEIEAQQDAVLEPLNYQETMWELEKTSAETKLERIKAELETYNNLCKEEIQNAAPKFGLG